MTGRRTWSKDHLGQVTRYFYYNNDGDALFASWQRADDWTDRAQHPGTDPYSPTAGTIVTIQTPDGALDRQVGVDPERARTEYVHDALGGSAQRSSASTSLGTATTILAW